MKILLVGGGSGGHITPLLAIANKINEKHPLSKIAIVSERRGAFNHLFESNQNASVYYINAGKYRRYYGESFARKIFDFKTFILNIRDIFKLALGVVESLFLLLKIRPNVVFIKGGYVGVPVGLASRILRIPYVTHDSDALPGLTNRLIAKKARANAVGMPIDNYPYPKNKLAYVGIPVTKDFLDISEETRLKKRKELEVVSSDFLVLITGGSNGAQRLDGIVHASLKKLLDDNPKLNIIHQVGKGNEELYADFPAHLHSRIRVASFLRPLSSYIAAADVVITRAGATAITEIGLQKKPIIIVPNPYLSGGHQLKNAKFYKDKKSALVLNENEALEDPRPLVDALEKLISSKDLRDDLATRLYGITQKNAAEKITELLTDIAHKKGQFS